MFGRKPGFGSAHQAIAEITAEMSARTLTSAGDTRHSLVGAKPKPPPKTDPAAAAPKAKARRAVYTAIFTDDPQQLRDLLKVRVSARRPRPMCTPRHSPRADHNTLARDHPPQRGPAQRSPA